MLPKATMTAGVERASEGFKDKEFGGILENIGMATLLLN